MKPFLISVEYDKDGERLDRFLASELDGLSRTRIQWLISEGYVSVSGKTQKPGFKLTAGSIIDVKLPPEQPLDIKPADIPLDIVYEDSDIIVINKPKNMVVHPAPGHYTDTLVNALLFHCGSELSGINGVMRPGIIHRIDKDTTGLLVVAKNNDAHISLSSQLEQRRIERIYEAVVFGQIRDDNGTIDAPIGRHERERVKMSVTQKSGRHAVTHFRVIKRFEKYTHVKLKLETGRTHQIRVHMAYINHPVLGDSVYSRRKQPLFAADGQTLHAKSLSFFHPRTDELMSFDTELPLHFREILRKIDGK